MAYKVSLKFGSVVINDGCGEVASFNIKTAFEVGQELIKAAMKLAREEIEELEQEYPKKIADLQMIAYADFSIDKIEVDDE